MDFDPIVSFVQGWILLLASFSLALAYAVVRGRQNLINLLIGMYFGLFLHKFFPFTNTLIDQAGTDRAKASISISVFAALTVLSTILFTRLMPSEYLEGKFESMGKKILLALAAMLLTMTLTLHYLPLGEIVNIGTPIPESLQTEKLAFLWLVLPLVAMFLF